MRNRKSDIEKYLRGELSPAEMHALEKEALKDPFLAEALEGVEQTGTDNFLYDLHRINRSVHDRSRRRSTKNNKTIRMWGWTSAVAATVLLVAVSGFLVINILRDQAARGQAMRELASLQSGEGKKDTVLIPLPHETSVVSTSEKMKAPLKEERPSAGGGITENESETLEPLAHDAAKSSTPETSSTTEPGDASKEVLALSEAQRERESTAKAETAPPAENPSLEEEQSKSAVADDDKARRVAKRFDGRAAGAESRAQEPAVSGAITRDAATLRGKVVSARDGEALPGVNVIIEGTRDGTVTDTQGNFQLTIPEDKTRIVFSFIGYLAEQVEAKGQEEINVQLRDDMTTLSEVVVTGYASDGASAGERSTFSFAEPEGGRTDFKNYLNNAIRYPAEALNNKTEGPVTVRFTVETNGALTDFEVLKAIGRGCEEELIRAIRNGPSWRPSSQGERALRDQVKVRFKFQLPD